MIASKLILIFCLYFLLLLDNSLGQKLLITQDGNKALFQRAVKFGQTYRGELGLLASLWKQLLIQLVHAKRNVGLGKVQLARFNDSAMTEEVGLVIPASYADKVAELVAIRTQDIGTTQKYIDELEILKNEIALTMIVEMDEIEAQFKEKNVREKVKEAKENGLTDTDIKEILFANFFGSEGLSLIGAGASVAEALLSSFLDGMKSILYKTYFEKPGITQYGNVIGCLPFGNCVGEGGDNGGNNNGAGGGGGDPGGGGGDPGGDQPPGGGGGNPGGAAGGGEPPGGGGGGDRPPYYRPNGKIGDIDDEKSTNDPRINDDINEFFEEFIKSLPKRLREKPKPSPVDPQNEGDSSPEDVRVILPDGLEAWLFNLNGDGLGVEQDSENSEEEGAAAAPNEQEDLLANGTYTRLFTNAEVNRANERVSVGMDRRRAQVQAFEQEIQILQSRRAVRYFRDIKKDEKILEPDYDKLNNTERARILNFRIARILKLLIEGRRINSDLYEYRIIFERNYYRARDNVYYYARKVGWDLSKAPNSVKRILKPLSPLPEFRDNDGYEFRYLQSREHLLRMLSIGQRLEFAANNLRTELDELRRVLANDKAILDSYELKLTPENDENFYKN